MYLRNIKWLLNCLFYAFAGTTTSANATVMAPEGQAASGNKNSRVEISFQKLKFNMIYIPKGVASIGCNQVSEKVNCTKFETPQFNVEVASFYMMETEVSVGLWHACVKEGACKLTPADVSWHADDMPVVNVSWNEINSDFIPWLTNKTGVDFRLPTEYEWEYAAAAGEQKDYTWENEVVIHNASCANCGSQWDNKQPVPVKFFKANAFGLFNMLGNVAEWASDCFERNHTWFIEKREKKTVCESHPIKGGAWVNATFVLVPHSRVEMGSDSRYEHIGFRLVADNINNLKVAK